MSLLTYTVTAASSEDAEHPARELESFHSASRGWQSAHFCDFPQELILKFSSLASVQQVQLLSHQFKIATRVELFIGTLAPGVSTPPARGVAGVSFTRLGHFSLDGNERSKFQARELKTVYVPRLAEGHYLRLLLHKCHVNEHNLYNQLGVLAIRVVGTGGAKVGPRELDAPRVEPLVAMAERPPPIADAGREPAIDGGVMAMLQELFAAKDAAVAAEDYEEAKRLKVSIEKLRAVGVQLCDLERKKIAAVAREDYDAAKLIKDEINVLRASAGVPQPPPPAPPHAVVPAELSPFARRSSVMPRAAQHPSESSDPSRDYELQAAQDRINRMAQEALAPAPAPQEEYVPPHRQPPPSIAKEDSLPEVEPPPRSALASPLPREGTPPPQSQVPAAEPEPPAARPSMDGARSSRPASGSQPIGSAVPDPPAAKLANMSVRDRTPQEMPPAAGLGGLRRATNQREHDERPIGAARPPPPEAASSIDSADDVPPAEPLTAAARKEADANGLLELFGEELVGGLYSRTWSVRQAAMSRIGAVLPSKMDRGRGLVTGAVRVMLLGAADKMVNVFLASFEVESALLASPISSLCAPSDAERELRPLLEKWRDKLGDSNSRVREAAEGGIFAMCNVEGLGPVAIGHLLVAPLPASKRNNAHAWLGRLTPLKRLLKEYGNMVSVLTTPALKLVKEALGSASGAVRSEATEVAHELYALVGDVNIFSRHLADLKPALRDPLLESLERGGGGLSPSVHPAATRGATGGGHVAPPAPPPVRPPHDEPVGVGEEEDIVDPDQCQFCLQRNPAWESEEALDLHFWKECPMLTSCEQCAQVVECAGLNEHLIHECDCSKAFRYPPPLGQDIEYYGCPFCKRELPQDASKLRQHLMKECKSNPRRAS